MQPHTKRTVLPQKVGCDTMDAAHTCPVCLQVAALAQDSKKYNAALCILISVVTAQLLGLTIYAWAPWTTLE